jgi:hypothetical protein
MAKTNRKFKLIFSGVVILSCFYFSVFLSHYTYNTDFGLYYSTAKKILESNTPNTSIYDIDTVDKYSIPEAIENAGFPYSMPVAYIMSPLALMPYFKAKAAMIFINILMYLSAISIALKMGRASGRWFAYPLALLCLWWPFIQNMRQGQVNGILLFLVALAVLAATKNRPTICGIFLAIAALFKLFPIAIAMMLGIKNWRIFASCLFVFIISFLVPGSPRWIEAISSYPRYYIHYSFIYSWLKQFGLVWFWIYASTIAAISALIVYRAKNANYPIITSFAILAVFLTMPILEITHFTLLPFSYAYLLVSAKRSNRLLITSIFISFIMISISFFSEELLFSLKEKLLFSLNTAKVIRFLGLAVFWAALTYNLSAAPSVRRSNFLIS